MEELNFDHLQLVLDEYGREFTEKMKTSLQTKDSRGYNRVASGALLASLRTTTEPNSNHSVYKVYLHHKPYLKYIENGTRPHWAPIDPLIRWVKEKRIPTGDGKKGNLPTEKQVAYMVQHKIAKEGTQGTPYVEQTQDVVYPKFEKRIQEAVWEDVNDAIMTQRVIISIHVV